jgi:hypothetical protein
MSLSSIVLTPFTGAYYLGCVSHDNGPVESMSKRVFNKGSWRYMVTVDASIDVL